MTFVHLLPGERQTVTRVVRKILKRGISFLVNLFGMMMNKMMMNKMMMNKMMMNKMMMNKMMMNNMKQVIAGVVLSFFVVIMTSMAPGKRILPDPSSVNWMTFEEAVEKSKTEKRKIFVDVYTDWCGWCKVMDKKTFNDPAVAKLLNEKFYPVKFNAEQREDVTFNGNTFKFIEDGGRGTHQLAAALLNNQLSYPTVVFLDEQFKMIQPLPGFRKAPEFHKIAQFIGDDHYKTIKWNDWEAKYQSPF